MPGLLKTEAVVLRSIRYGEADRILHLYTPGHGRMGAIAKGVRRARSRFGARLEPFFHVRAVLHEGRGELHTVTSVDTISAHPSLRDHAATLDAAALACDAVARLFESAEPHPEVFRLLCKELALLDVDSAHARPANGLAFRLKLLLAAGVLPQLATCAACGTSEHLHGFSAAAGGVVCSAHEAAAFPGFQLRIDLENQSVSTSDGSQSFRFEIDEFRKYCLLNGLDEIGLTLRHTDEIRAFEARRKSQYPWYF